MSATVTETLLVGWLMSQKVILAMAKDDINALPTLFKPYDSSTVFESCTIWQVARATSAAVGSSNQ